MDADAGGALDDAGADLEQAPADGGELGPGERHPARHGIAEREHQPVGGGVEHQPELVGERALAGSPVGGELALVLLDEVLGLAARAVDPLLEAAGLAGERGDDVARIEAAGRRLQPGDDTAFPAPRAGGVIEAGEAAHPVGAGLGAAHLEIVADLVCKAVQRGVAGQAEDVVDAVRLAPGHGLSPAVVAVAPESQPGARPVPADAAHQVLEQGAVRDERAWSGADPPGVVYDYAPGRSGKHGEKLLEGFRGTVQVDGYAGHNRLGGALTLAACWAHARRGLETVFDSSASPIAEAGLARIAQLYRIEEKIRGEPPATRQAIRWTESAPLVNAFGVWLDEQRSRLGEKLTYIANQPAGRLGGLPTRRARRDEQQLRRKSNPTDQADREKRAIRGPRRGRALMGPHRQPD